MNYPAYDARIFHDEDENALDVFAPYIVALKLGMKLLVKKGYVTDYDDDDMEHDENNQAVGNQPGGQAGGSNDSKDCWFAFEMAPPPPLRRPFLRLDNNQNGTDGDDGTNADEGDGSGQDENNQAAADQARRRNDPDSSSHEEENANSVNVRTMDNFRDPHKEHADGVQTRECHVEASVRASRTTNC